MEKIKLVSFNLRCLWTGDGINSFIHRVGMIVNKIRSEKPTIMCFQEATPQIIECLRKQLTEYSIVFNGRDENMQGEGLAVAFNQNSLELIGLNCFWLSDTPNVPGSRYQEQSYFPRICQSVLMQDKSSGKTLRIYNNHLDHISEQARILETKQILQKIKDDTIKIDSPIIILGDFNAEPDSETISLYNNNEFVTLTDVTADCEGTFHNFGQLKSAKKIDYIYTDNNTASKVSNLHCWKDEYDGIYLSDHYPINIEIDL